MAFAIAIALCLFLFILKPNFPIDDSMLSCKIGVLQNSICPLTTTIVVLIITFLIPLIIILVTNIVIVHQVRCFR